MQLQENISSINPVIRRIGHGAAISTRDYINSGLYVAPRAGYQMKRAELYLGFQNVSSKYKNRDYYWGRNDRFSFGVINFGANFFSN